MGIIKRRRKQQLKVNVLFHIPIEKLSDDTYYYKLGKFSAVATYNKHNDDYTVVSMMDMELHYCTRKNLPETIREMFLEFISPVKDLQAID